MSMPHPDTTFLGKRVSWAWGVIFTYVFRVLEIDFRLNSGRRTEFEQRSLIRQKGLWSPSNRTGAAPYSPDAPHIAKDKQNHANDIDSWKNGENRVQAALIQLGLVVVNNVPGEAWHQQVMDESSVIELAEKLEAKMFPKLYKGVINRSATTELQKLLRGKGYKSVRINGRYDLTTRLAARRYQRKHRLPTTSKSHVTEKTWRSLRGWTTV